MFRDVSYLRYVVGSDEESNISNELDLKMLNTKDRHYAEIKANANFNGQSISVLYKQEDMKVTYEFNPDNL